MGIHLELIQYTTTCAAHAVALSTSENPSLVYCDQFVEHLSPLLLPLPLPLPIFNHLFPLSHYPASPSTLEEKYLLPLTTQWYEHYNFR